MTNSSIQKRPRAKSLDSKQKEAVVAELVKIDFALWYQRTSSTDARKRVGLSVGFLISTKDFKTCCHDTTKWFRQVHRPQPPSLATELDFDGWQRLRTAVSQQVELIQGRSIDEAVAIISVKCRCNRRLLDGLASDLHFWRKGGGQ